MGLLEDCEEQFGTNDLYQLFGVEKSAPIKVITLAYRKKARDCHPDKAANHSKELATARFQILVKAYDILKDEGSRGDYDQFGTVDEEGFSAMKNSDMSWEQYFDAIFKKVTLKDLEDYEKKYRNSAEEWEDLMKGYTIYEGDMDKILEFVPFSTIQDEERFIERVEQGIRDGEIEERYDIFFNEPKSRKMKRAKKWEKEAREAEKENLRRQKEEKEGTKKGSSKRKRDEMEPDLFNMIAQRQESRKAQADGFFRDLEEKYGKPSKGKKGSKAKHVPYDDIDEEAFQAAQARVLGKKKSKK
eukprot:Clim_evm19s164 gene=Clim_evmTU19s164